MSCATARCGDLACPVCTMTERFRVTVCTGRTHEGRPCTYVAGHPGEHHTTRPEKITPAELKTAPKKVSTLRPAEQLAFRKRHRVGPHRGNA